MTYMPESSAVAAATISAAHAVAVPHAALERRRDGYALVFASASWRHLQTWISLAGELPPSTVGEDDAGRVLDNIREAASAFGSPAMVLQQLRDQPAILSGDLAPEAPYAAVIWWTGGLQEAAGMAASVFQRMTTPHTSAADIRSHLRLLAAIADQARRRVAPLLDGLTDARVALLETNRALSDASVRVGDMLLHRQDAVTGAHERVSRLERQLARLGLFNAHRKQAVLSRLHAMQRDRAAAMQREHCIELQLRAFDALLDEGAWIGPALADAIESLEKLRTAWTRFGAGMTQLAVESADAELADGRWLERTLGPAEAVRQWSALERAARDFMADLLPAAHQATRY